MRARAYLLTVALAAASLALGASGAAADPPSKVTIDGPADVVESGLFANLIEPQFKAAFPQYELAYNPSAQSTSAADAESGTGGPSVLLLHEPKLESEFVARGFSFESRFGSALFYSDFVLVGTAGDEAGVAAAGGGHDIARAFAAVAAAGVAGKITFESRGGTITASPATIAEHKVWALVSGAGLTPAGVALCDVTAADGGGMTPITPAAFASDPQAPFCPSADGGSVLGGDLPSWYAIASIGETSFLNSVNGCTGTTNGSTHCYALADRGPFDFIAAGKAPTASVVNLAVAAAEQSAAAPGGATLLLNRFHAFVIDPAKPGETVNLQGAKDLIGFLTSPAEQAQIGDYLKTTPKSPGAPFTPDAIPAVTAAPSATSVDAGAAVTVSGSVVDTEPGAPALAGQPVIVRQAGGAQLASGLLDTSGHFSIGFVPPASGSYEVATPALSLLLDPTAVPPFGDQLAPGASAPFSLTVAAPAGAGKVKLAAEQLKIGKVKVEKGKVTVVGGLGVAAPSKATVTLLVRRLGPLNAHRKHRRARAGRAVDLRAKSKKPALKPVASTTIPAGARTVTISHRLPRGFRYAVELSYAAAGQSSATSAVKDIKVP